MRKGREIYHEAEKKPAHGGGDAVGAECTRLCNAACLHQERAAWAHKYGNVSADWQGTMPAALAQAGTGRIERGRKDDCANALGNGAGRKRKMRKAKEGEFRSKVYTDRPDYADFDAPNKFMAIESFVAKRLIEHPKAICSYSGGSDSDIMLDMIERVRKIFNLPPIQYAFINTGLEMDATKRHVNEVAQKYGVEIKTYRPKLNVVLATRKYGQPFVSKIMSAGLEGIQRKNIPLSIADEYAQAEDKIAKRAELKARYPKCESEINFLCCCNSKGEPRPHIQLVINSSKYMLDFIKENPIPFRVSNKCCTYCKKNIAHEIQKDFEMVITGERRDEGGMRSVPRSDNTSLCFTENSNGTFRLKPLFYVSDADKAWYKEHYGIRYSDAYEVYGFTRTGCCGCSISSRAVDDLEKLKQYEPNLYKAAWNVFGDSYRYRKLYNDYKARRVLEEKSKKRDAG